MTIIRSRMKPINAIKNPTTMCFLVNSFFVIKR